MERRARRGPARPSPVSRVVERYRKRLIDDSFAFAQASLTLAQSLQPSAGFNAMTAEAMAAVTALSTWQHDAQAARAGVAAVAASARGRSLALQWLDNLGAALGLVQQSLSTTDPQQAAATAGQAQQAIGSARQLQDRLDRLLG
jgi:hypothetical protein